MKYSESIYQTKRWKTREVMVGNVGVGGDNPVRIQSMTTSLTRDVDATVDQIIRLADVGCEIARVTVQGIKEAEACEGIKNTLLQKGYTIPVVADIHFYPPAAMKVVDFVDKVRINPGNFVDKRAIFKTIVYDDATYLAELAKIQEKFSPLVEKCKTLKKAIRIGTNHGSLSDRIMNRYGDTPFGMVESALEFARVCRSFDFHDFMFSMKASNPVVMIQAYRLLVAEMQKLGWDYPLHLGVTESGDGEDGRIKSSMGIGALLLDGLGDTIRVSLTEDPWEEIDPCKRLVKFAQSCEGKKAEAFEEFRNIQVIEKRQVKIPEVSSLHRDGSVIAHVQREDLSEKEFFLNIGVLVKEKGLEKGPQTVDAILVNDLTENEKTIVDRLIQIGVGVISNNKISSDVTLLKRLENVSLLDLPFQDVVLVTEEKGWEKLLKITPAFVLLDFKGSRLHEVRRFTAWAKKHHLACPVLLLADYNVSKEGFVIHAGSECGALFADSLLDGICIQGPYPIDFRVRISFSILQGARMRSSKTEFISCPGCGRTLFQLQEVTQKIRKRTEHLPGVKIAIMGCIVNGPGEMADADFGYVGSKPGKIDLYIGKTCVQRDIEFSEAEEKLVDLIKAHGRWVEKDEQLCLTQG